MFWYKIYKSIKDKSLRKQIAFLEEDAELCKISHFGDKNRLKPIYYIEEGSPTIGFFAVFRIVLDYMAYADYYGMIPYVQYKDCISYHEEHPVNGHKNTFQYYFRIENGAEDVMDSSLVIHCRKAHFYAALPLWGYEKLNDYLITPDYYEFYARIIKKYIRIQPEVLEKMKKDIKELGIQSGGFLAVHYRGTDFKNNYGNHPVCIGIEDYLACVKKNLKEGQKFFLATDDKDALELFIREFGDRVVYYKDVIRADGKLSVICSNETRENHNYLLGYEVLRDMYTMSMGEVLISGLSQVSIFSEIFKQSRDEQYEEHIILSKGINHNSKSHVSSINNYRKKL